MTSLLLSPAGAQRSGTRARKDFDAISLRPKMQTNAIAEFTIIAGTPGKNA
jgi:hypothetical protein